MAADTPAPTVEARLDRICRRQQARFMDHLRDTRQATPRLEADVMRVFGFIFSDVKSAVRELSKEADRAENHRS